MIITIREAVLDDEEGIFSLASRLATSFIVEKVHFSKVFQDVLHDQKADLLIAEEKHHLIGYVLAFHHPAFYANGAVTWVEELFVDEEYRGKNIGKKLMKSIESVSQERKSRLVALATRRAGDFYKAIEYEESAIYYKKTFQE